MQTIDFKDFARIDLRVGTIKEVQRFDNARKPSYKIWVNLGEEMGLKKSSAQLTSVYNPEELIGQQVVCVCNLKPRQIADFMSEILITGFDTKEGVVITTVERPVPDGSRLY
ncbi:tRNA-binding protein [Algoriphagus sediminis]|uniref:tRNA-binding protein n=1 Tax=Algoriphagus sediminis TaxID=3057113 RepID=A0ABT7YCL9_9BACT|nr:tRNA-binding protein [Algoriphagus sediminis]MDN3204221.1 tRNA-binding protein [Algoriphagus sediminis]